LDFLPEQEINELLNELGVATRPEGEHCVFMAMGDDHAAVKHCLCNDKNPCESDTKTLCSEMTAEKMVRSLLGAIHKIHEGQTLMIPVGKWRLAFDAVAFSMAGDEAWQEFDASATIKLNTRDPLLFESGDEQLLASVVTSLMNDGETQDQGVYLIPVGAPVLVHIQPRGPVKFWFGTSVLADEVREAYAG